MSELSEVDKAKAADKERAKAEREAEKAAVKAESARLTAEVRALKATRKAINQGRLVVGGAGAASPPPAPVRTTMAELMGEGEEEYLSHTDGTNVPCRRYKGKVYVYDFTGGAYLGEAEITSSGEVIGHNTSIPEPEELKAKRAAQQIDN
jgi:hypothetical protein